MAPPRHAPRWRPFPFHLLLAPLPALLSYTHDNQHMATWRAALLPLAWTWAVAVPFALVLGLLCRRPRNAALATSLLVAAFYAHGAAPWSGWVAVPAALALLAWRGRGDALTTFANLLVAFGLLPGLWTAWKDAAADRPPRVRPGYLDALDLAPTRTADLPDIWYLVLDGYGREDVLRELYGIEEGLAEGLRARGFYVADEARSNYAQTALSFASALNMAPLDELLVDVDRTARNRLPLVELVAHNRVARALRGAGYTLVEFPGEYSITRLADPDARRGPWLTLDEYAYELAEDTALLPLSRALGLEPYRLCHEARRHVVDAVFDGLARGDRDPGPTFVYAHVVAPHPPFVFRPDGGYRSSRSSVFFGDGTSWRSAKRHGERYDEGYRDQAAYVDRRVLEVIDGILARSERPPVILVQGDHGPGLHLDWSSVRKTDLRERMGILSAYLLPDAGALYPSITPVNSFRVVLNEVLGTSLPLVPDRSWFSTFARPYVFTEHLPASPAAP